MVEPAGGIPFWDEKLLISRILLGGYTASDVADLVYPRDAQLASQVKDNFRKWRRGRPKRNDGPKAFFDALAATLECDQSITGAMLVESDIDQFISYLPAEKQDKAREALQEGAESDLPARADEVVAKAIESSSPDMADTTVQKLPNSVIANFRAMMFRNQGAVESIERGIKLGRINQRHYYLTPDAASTWSNLVRAEAYPTYDQCKSGLRALVETTIWQQTIAAGDCATVVMLAGGGAPTKDIVLINSLLHTKSLENQEINYLIVDISPYMLMTSVWWLEESLVHVTGGERVQVTPVYQDVMKMHDCKESFRHSKNVIFGMTGGTIGNLSEEEFFKSLGHVAESGDLFILSADTLGDTPLDVTAPELIEKYNHREMHRFISPAIRALIAELDLSESVRSALNRVNINLRDAKKGKLSDVNESLSVTLTFDTDERNFMLLSSTRYRADALASFADRFGWELLLPVCSPLNERFIQFLFRRK